MEWNVLADDKTERVNGSNDEYPFRHAKLLTLHDQACVQTQANEGIGCDEKDPFRDLG